MQAVRSVVSGDKFYPLPPDKENTAYTEPSLENQAQLIETNAIFTGEIILTYMNVANENKKSET